MMRNQGRILLAAAGMAACAACGEARGDSVDVTVRHAPYVVSTVSSKSERAWTLCKYCGSRVGYDRTYRWDVYNHQWVETTKANDIPDTCHRCQSKAKDQKRLEQRERELDEKIRYEDTKRRIERKEKKYREKRSKK